MTSFRFCCVTFIVYSSCTIVGRLVGDPKRKPNDTGRPGADGTELVARPTNGTTFVINNVYVINGINATVVRLGDSTGKCTTAGGRAVTKQPQPDHRTYRVKTVRLILESVHTTRCPSTAAGTPDNKATDDNATEATVSITTNAVISATNTTINNGSTVVVTDRNSSSSSSTVRTFEGKNPLGHPFSRYNFFKRRNV